MFLKTKLNNLKQKMAKKDQDMGRPVPNLDYIKENVKQFMFFDDDAISTAVIYIRESYKEIANQPDKAFKTLVEEMGFIAEDMDVFYQDFEPIDDDSDMSEVEENERVTEIRSGEHFIIEIDHQNCIISGEKLREMDQLMLGTKCRNMICYLNSCLNWFNFVGIPFNIGGKKGDGPQINVGSYIDFLIDMRRTVIDIYNSLCANEYYLFLLAEPMTRAYPHWDPYDGYIPKSVEYHQGLI